MTLQQFFDGLFKQYSLSAADKQKYTTELSTIIFLTILEDAHKWLGDDEKLEMQGLAEQRKYEELLQFVQNKYPPTTWDKLIAERITPLLNDYTHNLE